MIRLLFCCFILSFLKDAHAQVLQIEVVPVTKEVSFPIITSDSRPEVATRINQYLQRSYFDTTFTKQGIRKVILEQVTGPEGNDQFQGWDGIELIGKYQNNRYLKLNFEFSYTGAYDTQGTETLLFDIQSGNQIDIPSLFSINGYFDFLDENWLSACFEQVKDAHECETGERQLEGECYNSCFTFEQFYIRNDSLVLITNDCYPHVLQNCNPVLHKSFSLRAVSPYLNGYGRYILLGEPKPEVVTKTWFLTGKLDDKYRIRMALEPDKDDPSKLQGYYFYEKYKKKIKLEGSINGKNVILREYLDSSFFNGEFKLEWDTKYFPTGIWLDKAKLVKMEVELRWINEVDD
ncbi:MAG: hypothetical protein IT258_08240 [Saprospiraceae bacterium]|nr:hypothetical protein [Saprospiraceae bacterium]